jgi:hypothetical protein
MQSAERRMMNKEQPASHSSFCVLHSAFPTYG